MQTRLYFRYTTLQLELLVLTFIKSLRTGNFTLYVDNLTKLVPWFFILHHTNYARWCQFTYVTWYTPSTCRLLSNSTMVLFKKRKGFSQLWPLTKLMYRIIVPSRVMEELLDSLNLLKLSDDGCTYIAKTANQAR